MAQKQNSKSSKSETGWNRRSIVPTGLSRTSYLWLKALGLFLVSPLVTFKCSVLTGGNMGEPHPSRGVSFSLMVRLQVYGGLVSLTAANVDV